MRICTDGYLDLRDQKYVRMPGLYEPDVEPMSTRDAVAFLLSHTFPGHRRVTRTLTTTHRTRLRLASWSDSVSERMGMVDRVWREITEPADSPADPSTPEMAQVLHIGHDWAYLLYFVGDSTRVVPKGGVGAWEVKPTSDVPHFDLTDGRPD
jgi:hypothetical protein